MTNSEYLQTLSTLAQLLGTIVGTPAWLALAASFIKLAEPVYDMVTSGRDPLPAERDAVVAYRHQLSAVLQAIPTGQ